jgi:hypothetical protein
MTSYEEGKDAHLSGFPVDQNPCHPQSGSWYEWRNGWLQAEYTKLKAAKDQEPLPVDDMLTERGKRYGKFVDHARVTQDLKIAVRAFLAVQGKRLADDQQEAIDMIFHKVGRVVCGDPNYVDSWADIAGYATLIVRRLEGNLV